MTKRIGKGGPQTQAQAQVELQKFVQRTGQEGGPTFTQGAAEFLSKMAAAGIAQRGGRRQTPARVDDAKNSFADVVKQIKDHAKVQRIDLRTARQLRSQERFCGVRPWC
jgi:hypothetical protein